MKASEQPSSLKNKDWSAKNSMRLKVLHSQCYEGCMLSTQNDLLS